MVHPGRYADDHPAPGSPRRNISAGEGSILEQYELAIDAARSSIYIENQALPVPAIARRLELALRRGVEVVVLVPAEPEASVYAARCDLTQVELFECVETLNHYAKFALAGLIQPKKQKTYPVYVHTKAMLIDDN